MLRLEVFDPPMCCSTGICGSSADPTLVTFASDLEWLKEQGVNVVRHGISFEPSEFTKNGAVQKLIDTKGDNCLPIIMIGESIVSHSRYPSRYELAEYCKIEFNEDEAPPIHREENCCCGLDCDCSSTSSSEGSCATPDCDCSNAPAEQNCYCEPKCDYNMPKVVNNLKEILYIIFLLVVIIIIAIALNLKNKAESIANIGQLQNVAKIIVMY